MPFLLLVFCLTLSAQTADFAGDYQGEQIKLRLGGAGAGYTGVMELHGVSIPVTAKPSANGLDGKFRFENIDYTFQVRREGNAILLTSEGATRRLAAVAQQSSHPLVQRPAGSILGTWNRPQGVLQFNADGTGSGAGEAFQYEANG